MPKYLRRTSNGDIQVLTEEEKNAEDANTYSAGVALFAALFALFAYQRLVGTESVIEKVGAAGVFIAAFAVVGRFAWLRFGLVLVTASFLLWGAYRAKHSSSATPVSAGAASLQPQEAVADDSIVKTVDSQARGSAPLPPNFPAESAPAPDAEASVAAVAPSEAAQTPPSPALKKFYFLVRSGTGEETVGLVAPDAEKAKTILRDFRGNPEVLRGPSEALDW